MQDILTVLKINSMFKKKSGSRTVEYMFSAIYLLFTAMSVYNSSREWYDPIFDLVIVCYCACIYSMSGFCVLKCRTSEYCGRLNPPDLGKSIYFMPVKKTWYIKTGMFLWFIYWAVTLMIIFIPKIIFRSITADYINIFGYTLIVVCIIIILHGLSVIFGFYFRTADKINPSKLSNIFYYIFSFFMFASFIAIELFGYRMPKIFFNKFWVYFTAMISVVIILTGTVIVFCTVDKIKNTSWFDE